MTDEEINKRIHEILGLCWNESGMHSIFNFTSSWEGFGMLWEWWQKQEKYSEFHKFLWEESKYVQPFAFNLLSIPDKYIFHRSLTEATIEFFKETKQ